MVVVILTHGEKGHIYGRDGALLEIEKILEIMNAEYCKNFRGKPKLFFIQACRGVKRDSGEAIDGVEPVNIFTSLLAEDEKDNAGFHKRLPKDADMFIAYCTTPGYVSWRNLEYGSWFIQTICDVFSKQAETQDLLSMMTEVNQIVSEKVSSTGHMQIPEPCSRLRKKFYFFPKRTMDLLKQPSPTSTRALEAFPDAVPRLTAIKKKMINFYQKRFSNIRIVPMDQSSIIPLKDVWINLRTTQFGNQVVVDYKACLSNATADGCPVVVSGAAGSGKSTLIKRICYGWADGDLPEYDLVLPVGLNQVSGTFDTVMEMCLHWLLKIGPLDQSEVEALRVEIEKLPSDKVLIIVDALDEKLPECTELQQMLFENDGPPTKYPLVITARPYKEHEVNCDHHFCRILPFTPSQQEQFVRKHFAAKNHPEKAEDFLKTLKSSPIPMQKVLATPLNLQLCLISGYSTHHFSQTNLFRAIFAALVRNSKYTCSKGKTCADSNWIECPAVKSVGHLAYNTFLMHPAGMLNFAVDILNRYDVSPELAKVGFLQESDRSVTTAGELGSYNYCFPHKTFQEFFAAVYLASESSKEDLNQFLNDLSTQEMLRLRCQQVTLFLFGLLNAQDRDPLAQELLNIIGMKVSPYVTENIYYLINLKNECKTDEQRASVEKFIAQNPGHHWIDLTVQELAEESGQKLNEISEGIYSWELGKFNKIIPILVFDGHSNLPVPTGESVSDIAKFECAHFTGPVKKLPSLLDALAPVQNSLTVLKLQLQGEDIEEVPVWSCFASLKNLRIDVSKKDVVSSMVPEAIKPLLALMEGTWLEFSARANRHYVDFEDLSLLPTTLRTLKLKQFSFGLNATANLTETLPKFPILKVLRIHKCYLKDADVVNLLASLKNCNSLKDLSMISIWCIGKPFIFNRTVNHILQIKSLEVLDFQDCSITEQNLDGLKSLIQSSCLKQIFLGWNRLCRKTQNILNALKNSTGESVDVNFEFLSWEMTKNDEDGSKTSKDSDAVPYY